MNKIMMKDIRRMIGATKGRFFSLTAIVTIGVAFFVGVSSSSSVMSASVDKYDDELNLKDITIYSNYGFDQEDLTAVKKLSEVSDAELSYFVDVTATADANSMITRIHSYNASSAINQFVLKQGRLPENNHECLSENGSDLEQGFALDSTVTFTRPDDDLSDYISTNSCKVVGTIDTPLYLDEVKENSTLANRYINTYLYIPSSAFSTDYYTEMNILLTDAKAYNSFSDDYETFAKNAKEKIEEVAESQQDHRHDVVVADAQKKYDDGLKDYETAKDEYDTKIADAKQQIAENTQKIADGEKEIEAASQKLQDSQAQLDQAYKDGSEKLKTSKAQLDQAAAELAQKKTDFETKKKELNQALQNIDNGTTAQSLQQAKAGIQQLQGLKQVLAQYDTVKNIISAYPDDTKVQTILDNMPAGQAKELLSSSKSALESVFSTTETPVKIETVGQFKTYLDLSKTQQSSLQSGIDAKITAAYKQLNDAMSLTGTDKELKTTDDIDAYTAILSTTVRQSIVDGIASGDQQIADAQAKITQGYADLDAGTAALEKQTKEAQAQITQGNAELQQKTSELTDGKAELVTAQQELDNAIADGTQKLEDAKSSLDKAQQDISDLAAGKWTVLDRTEHYASAAYKNTIHQMKAIAAIFPVFFFMVAALVCLTTMTRMVDEQRGQIGIMRALGYSQKQCAEKYLIYAGTATIIGGIIGCIAGMLIFPGVIYNAWKMMYILPAIDLTVDWTLISLTLLSFLGVMLATTWYACHEDMKEVSAQLMRPKSPKLGRSTLIEKMPLIWNHLSFTWKVTVRNLIRYKKRFFMSVFGVAGCTALIITGFGIRDSIQTIATKQFEEIYQYDGTASFNENLSVSEINSLYQTYSAKEIVSSSTLLGAYSGKAYTDDDDETVYMQIFDQSSDIDEMYHLRVRTTQEPLSLSDDGVIISEKLSENLKKKTGDTLIIESKDGVRKEVKITGICEMYVRHYVFMTKTCYKNTFGVEIADNTIAVKLTGTSEQNKALQTELAESDSFSGVEFFDTLLDNFNQMIKGLDIIVLVLIVSSASLAGVVLGNLTNVNISERMREIATLKVLGFRRKEVENYIYKENNVLTLIGSLVGIPLGMLLHHYIMHQVEMDYIMFGRNITVLSCIICVLMTLGFGVMVNLFMAKHLRKIQMVESLKSVE
jgi:putative ABC transport system permease protein